MEKNRKNRKKKVFGEKKGKGSNTKRREKEIREKEGKAKEIDGKENQNLNNQKSSPCL